MSGLLTDSLRSLARKCPESADELNQLADELDALGKRFRTTGQCYNTLARKAEEARTLLRKFQT